MYRLAKWLLAFSKTSSKLFINFFHKTKKRSVLVESKSRAPKHHRSSREEELSSVFTEQWLDVLGRFGWCARKLFFLSLADVNFYLIACVISLGRVAGVKQDTYLLFYGAVIQHNTKVRCVLPVAFSHLLLQFLKICWSTVFFSFSSQRPLLQL